MTRTRACRGEGRVACRVRLARTGTPKLAKLVPFHPGANTKKIKLRILGVCVYHWTALDLRRWNGTPPLGLIRGRPCSACRARPGWPAARWRGRRLRFSPPGGEVALSVFLHEAINRCVSEGVRQPKLPPV